MQSTCGPSSTSGAEYGGTLEGAWSSWSTMGVGDHTGGWYGPYGCRCVLGRPERISESVSRTRDTRYFGWAWSHWEVGMTRMPSTTMHPVGRVCPEQSLVSELEGRWASLTKNCKIGSSRRRCYRSSIPRRSHSSSSGEVGVLVSCSFSTHAVPHLLPHA